MTAFQQSVYTTNRHKETACFLKQINLHWRSNLTEEELQEQICDGISTLNFIALVCDSNKYISFDLHTQGRVLFHSLLFLSKNNINDVIYSVLDVLETLQSPLVLNLKLHKVSLEVKNLQYFHTVVVIALSHIPKICYTVDDNVLLRLIRCLLTKLKSLGASNLCLYYLNVLFTIVKNATGNLTTSQMDIIDYTYTFLKAVHHHKQATKTADEILGMVIKQLRDEDKLILFKKISRMVWWHKGESAIVNHLISSWSMIIPLEPVVCAMTERLSTMLLENVTDHSIKLLRTVVNRISFETWESVFIPSVINIVATHCNNEWDSISTTISHCVKIGVRRFKKDMYFGMKSYLLSSSYAAIVLYECIEQDHLDIQEYQPNIYSSLHSANRTVQYYAVKCICNFNKKKCKLTNWHLYSMKYYLESTLFSQNFYYREVSHFLSHMVVCGNEMLLNKQLPTDFAKFICWLYYFICKALSSKNARSVNVGSQLFHLTQKTVALHELTTKYEIEYSTNDDRSQFIKYLKQTDRWQFGGSDFYVEIVRSCMLSKKVYPELFRIIDEYSKEINKYGVKPFGHFQFFHNKFDKESIMKDNYLVLYLLKRSSPNEEQAIVAQVFRKWYKIASDISDTTTIAIEEVSLIYGLTLCVASLLKKNLIEGYHLQVFSTCLQIGKKLIKKDFMDNVLILKNIEQSIVSIMEILYHILSNFLEKSMIRSLLEFLNLVFEHRSSKTVTSAAASTLHSICSYIFEISTDFESVIIEYLDLVLNSIYRTSEVKISKLRKHPEHRLVIHSIVSAERHPNHANLHYSVSFILDILSDPYSKHNVKESAFHTLDILICDSELLNQTTPYITTITIYAIEGFSSNCWNVKNGAIQVLKALTNRLLGQENNYTHQRCYGIDDLILLHPDLILYFIKRLYGDTDEINCDSVIAILSLLSESYYSSYNTYLQEHVFLVHQSLQDVFINLILTNKSVGFFAAKAYAALYPCSSSPDIICDIVKWLKLNFLHVDKNVFAAVMTLLTMLRNRFNVYCDNSFIKFKINLAFQDLYTFLKQFDNYEMSLYTFLGIQCISYNDLQDKAILLLSDRDNYISRVWLDNNLLKVLNSIIIREYPSYLEFVLRYSYDVTTLKQCVDSIISRFNELVCNSFTNVILNVLLEYLIGLNNYNNFVLSILSQIILLLLAESVNYVCSKELILKLYNYCVTTGIDIYKTSVYIAMFAHCTDYIDNSNFCNNIVKLYHQSALLHDVELQKHISSTLIYLHKCGVTCNNRQLVFETCFFLLFVPECSLQVRRFLSFLFDTPECDMLTILKSFLFVYKLKIHLGTFDLTYSFLQSIKTFVVQCGDEFEDCGTFYMKQNEGISSHKQYVLKRVEEQIDLVVNILPKNYCT
ncbi:hypothetical protein RI129_011559 [Pyrocoelia pectoralis]|uniref:DUF2428 domain-containing protein n=1 Tax=Pyrocoelia pectoralis TaxID=417401 RepID=A0AAN7ZDB8_9COLE